VFDPMGNRHKVESFRTKADGTPNNSLASYSNNTLNQLGAQRGQLRLAPEVGARCQEVGVGNQGSEQGANGSTGGFEVAETRCARNLHRRANLGHRDFLLRHRKHALGGRRVQLGTAPAVVPLATRCRQSCVGASASNSNTSRRRSPISVRLT